MSKTLAMYVSRPQDPLEAAEITQIAIKHAKSFGRETAFFFEDEQNEAKPVLSFLQSLESAGFVELHIIWTGGKKPEVPRKASLA